MKTLLTLQTTPTAWGLRWDTIMWLLSHFTKHGATWQYHDCYSLVVLALLHIQGFFHCAQPLKCLKKEPDVIKISAFLSGALNSCEEKPPIPPTNLNNEETTVRKSVLPVQKLPFREGELWTCHWVGKLYDLNLNIIHSFHFTFSRLI